MAQRQSKRLTGIKLESLEAGRHADGDGLYLVVDPSGARRWLFVFRWKPAGQAGAGRIREMGLGPLSGLKLTAARDEVAKSRQLLRVGKDPIADRKTEITIPTFGEVVNDYITTNKPDWKNAKHAEQWVMTVGDQVGPPAGAKLSRRPRNWKGWEDPARRARMKYLRSMRVDQITPADVLKVIKPLWREIPISAERTRNRIELVLDAAAAIYPMGPNPARWKGNMKTLLGKREKAVVNHPRMPFADVPGFFLSLGSLDYASATVLRFLILTAARTSEALGATWGEIDLEAEIWTIPAGRMKAGEEHRVPLSEGAIEILKAVAAGSNRNPEAYVFPGRSKNRPISNMTMTMLMRRLGVGEFTVHGFRSSFRDWCGEVTNYPRDLAEQALAHAVGNAVERAYRRSDALERRRPMMADWAAYCATPPSESRKAA